MKRTLPAAITVCLLLVLLCVPVSAQVAATQEATAGNTIYIAGNPDLSPLEYYDADEDAYLGVLPELYARLSEQTGLCFTYVSAGEANQQERMAKNLQVELISAHYSGDVDEGLSREISLLSYEREGETYTICVAFTEIMPEETAQLIQDGLESISDRELLELSVAVSAENDYAPPAVLLYILIAMLTGVVTVLLILILRARKRAKQQQENRFHDPLTGIGNSEYYRYCFEHHISAASYSLYYVAYIALDVQRLETYLGTSEAEEIQRFAAGVLSAAAADADFAARITDGVFALTFQSPSQDQATLRTDELLSRLNGYKVDFWTETQTLFRAGIFRLNSPNILCENALLNARQGYNYALQNNLLSCYSDDTLLKQEALASRLQLKLSDALKNNEFKMYLQFIVRTKTGEICGAEALSRWHSPTEGLLSPGHYIESMTTAGIIDRLDLYMLEEACRQLEAWSKAGKDHLWLSCNFTRITVSAVDFLPRFNEIVSRYSFSRKNLVVELTEDSLTDNEAVAFQNILACKQAGFRIALDDLGSGYSSFSDLCDYPIDIIKIDRHIVAKSVTPKGGALLKGIIRLAHDLGIKVLCEGVETPAENETVCGTECDYIQGFHYSRVIPQEDAMIFYEKYHR